MSLSYLERNNFFLIFIRYFISLICYIRHTFSFLQPRLYGNASVEIRPTKWNKKKKKKRLREGKAATTVAWHTIRIRPISCTWSEFLSNSSKGAPEPEKNQTRVGSFPKPLIHVPVRVWVYMCVCVCVFCASLYVCEESTVRISNSYHIKYNHRIIRRFINFNPLRPYFYQMQAFC